MSENTDVKQRLEGIARQTGEERTRRGIEDCIDALERRGDGDPYQRRVEAFHDELRRVDDGDYLRVIAGAFDPADLPTPADTPYEAESAMAEVMAERNRLFWAAFLSEEAGEVASCLTDGEPPENFREEVADVLILAHAIADCFGFDMLEAFRSKMDENDKKPKSQEGTGKLPKEARDDWREDGD